MFALIMIVTYPIIREIARTLTTAVHASRYSRWVRKNILHTSQPYAPTPIEGSAVHALRELLSENLDSDATTTRLNGRSVLLISDLHATTSEALTLEGNRTDSAMRVFVSAAIAQLRGWI
jgi:hypothetical protein